jgi:hypothetical protein
MSNGSNVNFNYMMGNFDTAAQYHRLIMSYFVEPEPIDETKKKIQRYIVSELERKRDAALAHGIKQFERMQSANSPTG